MTWKNRRLSFILALPLALVFASLFFSSSSYATSQSYTCSYSDYNTNCRKAYDSSVVGFSFSYVSIEIVGSDLTNVSKSLGSLYLDSNHTGVNQFGVFNSSGYLFSSFIVVDSYFYPSIRSNIASSSFTSYTISFYDSNPIAPCNCPEPDPCPEVPDNPYDDKLDNINKSILICGAIMIFIYFMFCIYQCFFGGLKK